MTVRNLGFMNLPDMRFRKRQGVVGSDQLHDAPGGARRVYAEYFAEEPANSPVTEDALILIECGSDGRDQALTPVQLGFDQKSRSTIGFIKADVPTGPGSRMTFTSYTIEQGVIVTTVKKANGGRETRRYPVRRWHKLAADLSLRRAGSISHGLD